MVILRGEVEHPPGVCHGVGNIAQRQGLFDDVKGLSTVGDAVSYIQKANA